VGLRAARRLGIPTVAVYQTDIAGFARHYRLRADVPVARWVGRLHRRADRTLVPSRSSYAQLEAMGVGDLHLWRRGVSLDLFGPERRSEERRAAWSRPRSVDGELLVGYVGRLAAEKQVRRLRDLADLPGTRLVLVGDGPERGWLERHLPGARFTGMLGGEELATAFASLDVFVHPGEAETFCQTVQEAQASGVAVVAAGKGGPVDLVEDGRTGLLYDVEDPRSLRRAVATVVGDPLLRRTLARAGREAVQGRTWDALVDRLVDEHYLPLAGLSAATRQPRAA
jgi:phosphatidylinositol alpha 1,6-mannosyltransferase